MTEPTIDPTRDPIDVLRTHVRSVALLERPETTADDLIASITAGSSFAGGDVRRDGSNVIPFRSPRRRRWLVATSAVAIVAVGSAGVAAYVGSRPERAIDGVVCRASIDDSSAIVLSSSDDPIAACSALWVRGDLPNIDEPRPVAKAPRLVACVSAEESLYVLPLPDFTSCADVGLRDADVSTASSDPVVELQRELIDRINTEACRSAAEVSAFASELLVQFDLSRWRIDIDDPEASCAAVALDPVGSRLIVFSRPSAPNPQEIP